MLGSFTSFDQTLTALGNEAHLIRLTLFAWKCHCLKRLQDRKLKEKYPNKSTFQKLYCKSFQFFGKQQFLLPLPGACPWQETWWLFPRLPWRFPQMDNKTSIGQTFCWKGQACQLSTHVPLFSGAVSWSKSTGSAESPGKAWQRHNAPGNSLKTPAMFGINGKETCVFPATMRSSNDEFSPAGSSSSWMVGRSMPESSMSVVALMKLPLVEPWFNKG